MTKSDIEYTISELKKLKEMQTKSNKSNYTKKYGVEISEIITTVWKPKKKTNNKENHIFENWGR